jgi:hypothetical protein
MRLEMSNAAHHRAAERRSANGVNCASAAPVHVVVRRYFLGYKPGRQLAMPVISFSKNSVNLPLILGFSISHSL